MKFSKNPLIDILAIVAIVAILAAILFPVFAQNKNPRRIPCISNLKQLAIALILYSGDSDDKLPNRDEWMDLTEPYFNNPRIEHCDKVQGPGLYGYALNAGVKSLKDSPNLGKVPLVYDSINLAKNASDRFNSLPNPGRHDGANCIAYCDGHARMVRTKIAGESVQN